MKSRTLTETRAFGPDASFMGLNDFPGNKKPQSEARNFIGGDLSFETVKDSSQRFPGNSYPFVPDCQANLIVNSAKSDQDRFMIAVSYGIGEEIINDLLNS